ncbi:uncharacterized protein LOC110861830 [Folsomia candida]|uniref:uncharacterized protein LOC110861830 n=1 Tax=Folsomia candida TaxID=158441 RepID=UPI000B906FEE|nr:uncharacterized protein LOC110861830 [Folsomia candida]XP_021966660.1 uncharacterized protein LOC110861830 [Folsomia candida]XP_035700877.1 uncharacterized protein LOC110861830 [Folsomia candida]
MSLSIVNNLHGRGGGGGGGGGGSASKGIWMSTGVKKTELDGKVTRGQSDLASSPLNLSMLSDWAGDVVNVEELTVFGRPWQYRGEGNANIVIALQDDLHVLRLSKVKVGGDGGDEEEEGSVALLHSQRRRVEREVAFANSVFIPLLGVEYVGHVQAVHLTPKTIQKLNTALLKLRPVYRLHKELRIPFATAHRDFARIHPYPSTRTDYCVEIKPKQGWWPKHLKHAKLCTYCLNQFLKLERSKIASRTAYCPLDLFSGNPDRMIRAIFALISNPQNNLRLFRDGLLVYGENVVGGETLHEVLSEWILQDKEKSPYLPIDNDNSLLLSNFVFLLCTALLKPKRTTPFSSVSREFDRMKTNLAKALEETTLLPPPSCPSACEENDVPPPLLPEGCILSRILDIQRMADVEGGVEAVYALHSRVCPVHSDQDDDATTGSPCDQHVIENLGDIEKKKKKKKGEELGASSSSSSENDDVFFEMDVHSNSSSSLDRSSSHRKKKKTNAHEDMVSEESETSGLESLSQEEDDDDEDEVDDEVDDEGEEDKYEDAEDEEVTMREEQCGSGRGPCPGPGCTSVEKWLDDLDRDKVQRSLSDKELADIESYLVAATAKDCSIMVTFSPIFGDRARARTLSEAEADSISTLYSPTSPSISNYEESDLILQDLHGTFHRVRIGVADLDPKPISCIVKHYLRDVDMLADFSAYKKRRRRMGGGEESG